MFHFSLHGKRNCQDTIDFPKVCQLQVALAYFNRTILTEPGIHLRNTNDNHEILFGIDEKMLFWKLSEK